jgi:HSP20 family protein
MNTMCQQFENRQGCASNYQAGRNAFKRKLQEMRRFGGSWDYPPVNVREEDDKYELYVYAPGLSKESFQIAVADGVLIIKTDPKQEPEKINAYWRRQEFQPDGFKRRFELPEGTDTEAISARYENGLLLITLPKLEDFHTKRRTVEVD